MSEECCVVVEKPTRARRALCPECGRPGIRVPMEPVKALVWEASRVRGEADFLCEARGCETVSFDGKGDRILRSELGVRVGVKEVQAPHLVCYCFSHTEEAVEAEIRVHGRTPIPDRIRTEIAPAPVRARSETHEGDGVSAR